MDLALAPKLLAAALVGGAVATSLPRPAPVRDAVLLKLEWIGTGNGPKEVQALVLRTLLERPTTLAQGFRSIEATPTLAEDGTYLVKLKVTTLRPKALPETLDTEVRSASGETIAVMGETKKSGKSSEERLFFLTTTPVE